MVRNKINQFHASASVEEISRIFEEVYQIELSNGFYDDFEKDPRGDFLQIKCNIEGCTWRLRADQVNVDFWSLQLSNQHTHGAMTVNSERVLEIVNEIACFQRILPVTVSATESTCANTTNMVSAFHIANGVDNAANSNISDLPIVANSDETMNSSTQFNFDSPLVQTPDSFFPYGATQSSSLPFMSYHSSSSLNSFPAIPISSSGSMQSEHNLPAPATAIELQHPFETSHNHSNSDIQGSVIHPAIQDILVFPPQPLESDIKKRSRVEAHHRPGTFSPSKASFSPAPTEGIADSHYLQKWLTFVKANSLAPEQFTDDNLSGFMNLSWGNEFKTRDVFMGARSFLYSCLEKFNLPPLYVGRTRNANSYWKKFNSTIRRIRSSPWWKGTKDVSNSTNIARVSNYPLKAHFRKPFGAIVVDELSKRPDFPIIQFATVAEAAPAPIISAEGLVHLGQVGRPIKDEHILRTEKRWLKFLNRDFVSIDQFTDENLSEFILIAANPSNPTRYMYSSSRRFLNLYLDIFGLPKLPSKPDEIAPAWPKFSASVRKIQESDWWKSTNTNALLYKEKGHDFNVYNVNNPETVLYSQNEGNLSFSLSGCDFEDRDS